MLVGFYFVSLEEKISKVFRFSLDPLKDIYQALSLPLMSSFISFALVKKFTVREGKKRKVSHASDVYD